MKVFSIRSSDISTEARFELLNQMPVRVLMRYAERHKLQSTSETVAWDIAQRPDLINLLKFSIDFKVI